MILVAGIVDVAQDVRDKALTDARPLIEAALAESGCRAYAWTADLSVPGRICVFEEWDNEASLIAHLAAEPYQNMLAHLSGVGILNAENRKFRIDLAEPVYDPQGKPRGDFFTD